MHKEFAVYMLNEEGKRKAVDIAMGFSSLLAKLEEVVPAGRELSLVKTKLEEACFFARKGMAMAPENQEGGHEVRNAHGGAAVERVHPAFDQRQCVHPMQSGSWCTNTARLGSPFCDEHGKPTTPEEK